MCQTSLALCPCTHKAPLTTTQTAVAIYLRYLPQDVGAQERDIAPDADLQTLDTAAQLAAASERQRTAYPLQRDARGPSGGGDHAAGLFAITGELVGSHDTNVPKRGQRAKALATSAGTGSPSTPFKKGGIP